MQVKHFFAVQLAHGGSVGAAHVVGINLQLRQGVNLCLGPHQQRAAGLGRICFLRAGVNLYAAIEHRMRRVGDDTLLQLPADAVGLCVGDASVCVGDLLPRNMGQAIQRALDTCATQLCRGVQARNFSTQRDADAVVVAVLCLRQRAAGNVKSLQTLALQTDVMHRLASHSLR